MGSLREHLREPGDHGRLGFHAECPVCRDSRLAGPLPADVIVSRRVQALAAVGALAFTSAAPASVLAAGGDHQTVGTADPVADSDPATDPSFDPGEDEEGEQESAATGVPDSTAATDPADPDDEGAGSAGDPPPVNVDPRSAAPAATQETPAVGQAPGAAVPGVSPQAGSAPTAGSSSPDGVAPASPEVAPVALRDQRGRLVSDARVRHAAQVRVLLSRARSGARVVRPGGAVQAVQVASHGGSVQTDVARPVVAKAVVPARGGVRAVPGDRVHVVFAGESLWSIAGDVLGGRPTVAQVAREVNRLWELNRARIGTGDRDLLPVGTRLVLK
jgi:hypothetical protein